MIRCRRNTCQRTITSFAGLGLICPIMVSVEFAGKDSGKLRLDGNRIWRDYSVPFRFPCGNIDRQRESRRRDRNCTSPALFYAAALVFSIHPSIACREAGIRRKAALLKSRAPGSPGSWGINESPPSCQTSCVCGDYCDLYLAAPAIWSKRCTREAAISTVVWSNPQAAPNRETKSSKVSICGNPSSPLSSHSSVSGFIISFRQTSKRLGAVPSCVIPTKRVGL